MVLDLMHVHIFRYQAVALTKMLLFLELIIVLLCMSTHLEGNVEVDSHLSNYSTKADFKKKRNRC